MFFGEFDIPTDSIASREARAGAANTQPAAAADYRQIVSDPGGGGGAAQWNDKQTSENNPGLMNLFWQATSFLCTHVYSAIE